MDYRMSKYTSLNASHRLHFKNLLDKKPDLDVDGGKFFWNALQEAVRILSDPADTVNIEKLPMRKGLATFRVAQPNGKLLVAGRIRESNVQAFYNIFPHLEKPAWFDPNFSINAAVDALFGLRIVNLSNAVAVYEPFKRKRKRNPVENVFREPKLVISTDF